MSPGPDEEYFCGHDLVDQKPVRLDVALPNALPFAGQFVRTVAFRKRASLCKHFDCGDEFFDVLAAALLSLEVVSELCSLSNSPHGAMLKRTHLFCPCRDRIEGLDAFACACLLDGAPCFLVRYAQREG